MRRDGRLRRSGLALCAMLVGAIPVLLGAVPHAEMTDADTVVVQPTAPPTATPRPSPSPTITPTATYPFHGTYTPPAATPWMEIPPPVPMFDVDQDALVNIVLLGSDSPDNYLRRTDVIILVSINTESGTVAMWHLPRALYVYIPNRSLDLLNAAYAYGVSDNYPGGGFGLLRDTFRYNFGIELDHFARVNYPGFMAIIEMLGGLDISVDCAISDWRLKDPDLDPALEENWEEFTLIPGRYHLSPYMTLWYVRSRHSSSDLDRGRRQMDVLRAMWQQAIASGLLTQVTEIGPRFRAWVESDMALEDVLPLVPLALSVDISQITRYGGAIGTHYTQTYTADTGTEVLIPIRENLLPMIEHLLTPPTSNRLSRGAITVEVADASRYATGLQQVAADRLAWEGYAARALDEPAAIAREQTALFDYTGELKGSALPELQRLLRVDDGQVFREPDPNRTVDYRVEIGSNYRLCEVGYAEGEIPPAPPAAYPDATCWVIFRAEVNVREGPGTSYPILQVADPTDRLPVVGRSENPPWWQVIKDGEVGWVSSELVEAQGECASIPVTGP